MPDYKQKIIDELNIILEKERQNKNTFKVRAYLKVIPQLKELSKIEKMEDIDGIEGIGKGIRDRIDEIIKTGELQSAEEIKNNPKTNVIETLMKIYGVGPVKAKELYEKHNIRTIEQLRQIQNHILNDKQKIGLKYYEDILERIPRNEMLNHEKIIKKFVATINLNMIATIVGSFRRQKPDSGDIDVLISYKEGITKKMAEDNFKNIIDNMKESGYMTDVLALGSKKCLAICKLNESTKYRRLDLLLTIPEEYPYALLYFTGSDKFNIEMRRKALENGYSLNEHGLKPLNTNKNVELKTEEDVFKFLDMKYLEPNQR